VNEPQSRSEEPSGIEARSDVLANSFCSLAVAVGRDPLRHRAVEILIVEKPRHFRDDPVSVRAYEARDA